MTIEVIAQSTLPPELQLELEDIRHSLLDSLLLACILIPVAWLAYIMTHNYASGWIDIAVCQSLIFLGIVFSIRKTHFDLACVLFVFSLMIGHTMLLVEQTEPTVMALGLALVVIFHALLGGWTSFIATIFMWFFHLLVFNLYFNTFSYPLLEWLSIYLMIWGVTWLASRPMRRAIAWSLQGWERGREALKETQERRGELYRALRSLEEATYRIERMNQELVMARRNAESARAAKERFAITVSHELRGPLSMILGFSRFMALSPEKYNAPLPGAYYADVDAIYRNAQHLSTLLDDILDLAQIEAERLPLIKDWVDIEEDICRKAVDIVESLADRQGLALHFESTGDTPLLIADAVRLRQVLLNLLTNAVRFTEQGSIAVRLACEGEQLIISVADTGSGIASEEMPRIFQQFHQVEQGREKGGSGLGLAISKQLVELHGGRMWVESEVGKGTTFFVSLPLPGTGSQMALPREVTPSAPLRQQLGRICLVFHMPANIARLLARYLEGYRIVALPDDRHAQSLIEELRPAAILTPPRFVEHISELLAEGDHDVPIIGCDIPQSNREETLQSVLSYLIKPVDPEILGPLMGEIESSGETTILLVDDEPDFVRLLEGMLTALPRPYRILKAYDGTQALERMRNTVPDVIFLDLLMPEMGGKQVLAHMRNDPNLRHVPVVIVSAQDESDTSLTLQLPLTVHSRQSVELGRAVKGLSAILDMIRPRYAEPAPFR